MKRAAGALYVTAYLINLDRSPERLAHMTAELGRASVAFTRVAAVDGERLAEADVADANPALSRGEIGCFLSHRTVWKRIADGSDPFAVVLEDDIHVASTMATLLADWSWIPPDADVVKIETMLKSVELDRQPVSTRCGHGLSRLRSTHPGTAGYIISATAAGRLHQREPVPNRPVDAVLFRVRQGTEGELVVYQIDPALCIQEAHTRQTGKLAALASTLQVDRKSVRRSATPVFAKIARETRKAVALLSRWHEDRNRAKRGVVRKRIPFAEMNRLAASKPPGPSR